MQSKLVLQYSGLWFCISQTIRGAQFVKDQADWWDSCQVFF
jgi:hypothetical protein